ncbi:MAG TPA: GIY-YIG nuclease family protein [Candidatus Obscuribacterales bacterium]
MNNQPSEYGQPKGYQLDEIWQKVLRHCHGFYQVLLRDYGKLLTFEETRACIRLCLFTGSWKLRLNKSFLTYSVTNAFSITSTLSFNQSLSQEFKVYIEVEEIDDQRYPFQYHPLKLEQLLSFPLPSVPLDERRKLPKCSGIYFVLYGDNDKSSRVLYVGMSGNIANRWKSHEKLKRLKSISGKIRIAWLEGYKDEATRVVVENLFIEVLEPNLNKNGSDDWLSNWAKLGYKKEAWNCHISKLLWERGWDVKAIKQATTFIYLPKTEQKQKLFVLLFHFLISEPNSIQHKFIQLPMPENWMPSKNDIVIWVHEGKQLPCRVGRVRPMTGDKRLKVTAKNCECELSGILGTETANIKEDLTRGYQNYLYVPLSELKPSQGLELDILEKCS